ncbi:MAG: isorenieratene synthase, partial [Gammaproteobacteria bacterium]|nr:isorenieratene synthase [Gammaproteobacteria bacterium]
LPRRTPQNVIALTLRSRALGFRDLVRIDKRRALEMLRFDPQRTYESWDDDTAANYLDSLRFPPEARRLLFDVFAHSFFNPEAEMSAGELLMMFHFYFTGNPEGLVFDVAKQPFSHAIWTPFARYLEKQGVVLRLGETAQELQRSDGEAWRLVTDRETYACDAVVLALPVPGLQAVVEHSRVLDAPEWRGAVRRLRRTNPFVVWRLWLDGPTLPGRAPFVGTTGLGMLDNISLYHLFEDESREWAS